MALPVTAEGFALVSVESMVIATKVLFCRESRLGAERMR